LGDALVDEFGDGIQARSGGEDAVNSQIPQTLYILRRDIAADQDQRVEALRSKASHQLFEDGAMGPGQDRESDHVDVLLRGIAHDLFDGLMQSGVDDFEPRLAEGKGDDPGPSVMTIEPWLGEQNADRPHD
jgi:hypothetical protein